MTEALLTASQLTRSFGNQKAVAGVSFEIPKGQAVGLLGPNGAGKTTILRMLSGCLAPSSGTIRISGQSMQTSGAAARRLIGYMPESAAVYGEMTAHEYLRFRAELSGRCPGKGQIRSATERAAARAHLSGALDRPIAHLSKGYRQRVMLAAALIGDPPLLLLDEPSASLDPNQVLELRSLIVELSREQTVIVSTHVLSEVEAACSHALILNGGQLIASGSLDELRRSRSQNFRVVYRGGLPEGTAQDLQNTAGFSDEDAKDGTRALTFSESATVTRSGVLGQLSAAGVEVLELGPVRAPLDLVFAELTRLDDPPPTGESRR